MPGHRMFLILSFKRHVMVQKFRGLLLNATRISGFIPEGCLKIAQRFNVGFSVGKAMSPEGTADSAAPVYFSRPFGTRVFPVALPNAEALGYSQMSLWDKAFLDGSGSWTLGAFCFERWRPQRRRS